jgi:hypothetical protein
MLVHFVPDAFNHLANNPFELRQTLTYFSFSVLTASSISDIAAVHPIARTLVNLEAICGQLFPTILLTRVVGLHNAHRSASTRAGRKDSMTVS